MSEFQIHLNILRPSICSLNKYWADFRPSGLLLSLRISIVSNAMQLYISVHQEFK